MSARSDSGEPATLVIEMVAEPQSLAQSIASTISSVAPDWLTQMAIVSCRSSLA
jgi:hypothetical protein